MFTASVSPCVASVNVARAIDVPPVRSAAPTAINKRPVQGQVRVHAHGVADDEIGDKRFHGGPDKVVYAFAREDLDLWSERLGTHLVSGSMFGENLTTVGFDVNESLIGERWRIGTVLLEVATVRIPCTVFANWLALCGHDSRGWMKKFTAEARPGAYLRVVEEGTLEAGDSITVELRPEHDVTVSTLFRALTTERDLLPKLLEVDALPSAIRTKALAFVAGDRISG